MKRFCFLGIPSFWKQTKKIQDEENRPLIKKETTQRDVTFYGMNDTSETKTDMSASNQDEKCRLWSFSTSKTYSISDLIDILLKYFLFLSNLFFSALGLAMLSLGFWGLINKESFTQEKLDGLVTDPMLLFVCLGLLISVLCSMGSMGVLRENYCLLRTFSIALIILVAAQVLVAIVAYSLQGRITELLQSAMMTAMLKYQDDLDLRFITDEIQTGLQCCGVNSYRDWELNRYFNCSSPGVQACGVPPSCCVDPLENGSAWNSQCGVGAQTLDEFTAQSTVFLGGCMGSISRWILQNTELISIVTIGLLGVQILTVTVTTHMLDRIQWNNAQACQRQGQTQGQCKMQ